MFKVILSRKKEVANILNQFIKLEKNIREEQLAQCSTEFITKQYKEKQADILYKLKDKPVYFLIEHQSTVNSRMLEKDMEMQEIEEITGLNKEEIQKLQKCL